MAFKLDSKFYRNFVQFYYIRKTPFRGLILYRSRSSNPCVRALWTPLEVLRVYSPLSRLRCESQLRYEDW